MNASEDSSKNQFTSPLEGVTIESIQITLDLYRSGKAGVPVDTLWQFACPILNHYQLELAVEPTSDVTPENADEITLLLDVLETASMVWDYCCQEPQQKTDSLQLLTQSLLGHSPDPLETKQFMKLLGVMEALWKTLSNDPDSLSALESPCEDPSWATGEPFLSTNGSTRYGPDKLDIPEAFALFSRPLLENDHILSDPDLLDEAMMRAQAYWDLAHTPRDQFEKHFSIFLKELGPTSLSKSSLKQEALTMIEHFYTIFPER